MPAASEVDPELLMAVAGRVALARDDAHRAGEALLGQLADTGERRTQEVLDALVDQAADTLRALTDELTSTVRHLRAAAAGYAETERAVALHRRRPTLPAPGAGDSS